MEIVRESGRRCYRNGLELETVVGNLVGYEIRSG